MASGACTRQWLRRWVLACLLAATNATAADEPSPVVLELFTSQGCSSCPAAEELLSRIGSDPRTRAHVVPLAYHVDYWDALGWRDPFSAKAWSLRQAEYERALRVAGGSYTPQLVIDGRVELNGTHARRVLEEVAAAEMRPDAASVALVARVVEDSGLALTVDVAAEIRGALEARELDLRVVVFENALVTRIARGENGGRTLRNDFVVRRLQKAFSLPARSGARDSRRLSLKLHRSWSPHNLGVAAFLQDPGSLRIVGAAVWQAAGAES